MKKVYVFNPETDLALSSRHPHYLPPKAILQMKKDLCMLPVWYADNGSYIWGDTSFLSKEFLEKVYSLFGKQLSAIDSSTILSTPVLLSPWGWNPTLCKSIQESPLSVTHIPDSSEMEQYKAISSKAATATLLSHLVHTTTGTIGKRKVILPSPDYLFELQSLLKQWKNMVIKVPWSSSGKGVHFCSSNIALVGVSDWCKHILKEQCCLIVEPAYQKIVDFAMEFVIENEHICFLGYSLFRTSATGRYEGNFIVSQQEIHTFLTEYIPEHTLESVKNILIETLGKKYGRLYHGPLGVDMMICRDTDSTIKLHPLIEINFRMNMGILALSLSSLLSQPTADNRSIGFYTITMQKEGKTISQLHDTYQEQSPLCIEDGKITKGYLALHPVHQDTHYLASMTVKELPSSISLKSIYHSGTTFTGRLSTP